MSRTFLHQALIALRILAGITVLFVLLLCIMGRNVRVFAPDPPPRHTPEIVRTEETSDRNPSGVLWHYTLELPAELDGDREIIFRADHMFTEVRIDGVPVIRTEPQRSSSFIRTPGKYWVIVPIQQKDAGSTAEIFAEPVYASVAEPFVRLIDVSTVMTEVIADNALILLLSILVGVEGLLFLFIALFADFERRPRIGLAYLGLLSVLASIWKLTELPFLSFFLSLDLRNIESLIYTARVVYLVSMIALMMMPYVTLCFIHYQQPSASPAASICSLISLTAFIVFFLLQAAGLFELHDAIIFYLIGNAVLLIVPSLLLLRESRSNLWFLIFPVAILLDLLIFILTGSTRYAVVTLLSIMINAVVRGIQFMRRTILHTRELQNAKTAMLVSQIRPHFIHNTLASVYYLCDSDPQKAKKVILDFSSYLQSNFTNITIDTPIPFSEELVHTKAYLSVEMTRFEGKLYVEYDTPHVSFRLPALTLQPIVENSVRYGVGLGISPEHILIRTRAVNGGSELVIQDDGSGYDPVPDGRPHVGLKNIRDRLDLISGGTLTIVRREEGGTRVTIFIPEPRNRKKEDIPWNAHARQGS